MSGQDVADMQAVKKTVYNLAVHPKTTDLPTTGGDLEVQVTYDVVGHPFQQVRQIRASFEELEYSVSGPHQSPHADDVHANAKHHHGLFHRETLASERIDDHTTKELANVVISEGAAQISIGKHSHSFVLHVPATAPTGATAASGGARLVLYRVKFEISSSLPHNAAEVAYAVIHVV